MRRHIGQFAEFVHAPAIVPRRPDMYRPVSVRSYLLGLILVVLVPLLGFGAYLVIRAAQHEQELLAETVRGRTREFARALERELANLRSHLFIVANVGTVEGEGFVNFYDRAHSDMERRGMTVILSDLSGNELLNTEAPLGATLPPLADQGTLRRVATTREPDVSDLTIDPVTHRPASKVSSTWIRTAISKLAIMYSPASPGFSPVETSRTVAIDKRLPPPVPAAWPP